MSEWVDESPATSAPRGGSNFGNAHSARGSIVEDVTVGTTTSRPAAGANAAEEDFVIGSRGARALPDGAKRMLANLEKHDSVEDAPPAATTESPPAVAAPAATSAPVVTPPAAAAVAPVVAPAVDPAAEHIARANRLEEHNRKLVAELAAAKGRPRGTPSARELRLDEADKGYLNDSVGSVRKFLATVLGVDDPASPDVSKELKYLYHDLTKNELGVALDPIVALERENERTKRMMERDRRERSAPAAPDESAARAAQDGAQAAAIAGMLPALGHAAKYPLLTAHSEALHSAKPEALIWDVIKHDIAAGVIQPDANGKYPDDATLIDHASKTIESRYQALRDRFAPAATSTATPTQPTVQTDTKADPSPGVRTITNASASVAPATLPAKPEPTTTAAAPRYPNEKARIKALIAKYSADAK